VLQANAGLERFTNEMGTVEQHRGRRVASRRLAVLLDDRILPAGDVLHVLTIALRFRAGAASSVRWKQRCSYDVRGCWALPSTKRRRCV